MTRREALLKTALLATAGNMFDAKTNLNPFAVTKTKPFLIGACDWSIDRTATVSVFDQAKKLGLDGVQISYNTAKDETWLSRPDVQQQMLAASKRTGVKIASIGIAEMNNTPLKSEPKPVEWLSNAIDAAKTLGVKVVLMAFFAKGDLRNDPAGKKVVIERLKQLAPKAEKNDVILGIESYLSAEEHFEIIDAVGSSNVQVYYDFRNATDAGWDIYKEIPLLGKRNLICEIHVKENGMLLEKGPLDWPRIRKALDEAGYNGWLQIEWAHPKDLTPEQAYPSNVAFARKVFG